MTRRRHLAAAAAFAIILSAGALFARALETGDPDTDASKHSASRENWILETFYEPVLDRPTYISRTGFRWPAEQRVGTERRAQAKGRTYVSDAEPYRIDVWSKATFWTVTALAIAATVLVFAVAHRSIGPDATRSGQ